MAKAEKLQEVSVQYKYADIGGLFLKQPLKQALKKKNFLEFIEFNVKFWLLCIFVSIISF